MRQAGRYLPEYRALRARAGSFLDLCYAPDMAAEVTLQPIRRYGFDAAILFSDILVVPDALGQKVEFVEGEGPRLEPIRTGVELARLNAAATRGRVRPRLRNRVARSPGSTPRCRSHRILRRAVDGGDLHGRRTRFHRSGGRAGVGLSRPQRISAADRPAGRDVGGVSQRAGDGGCAGSADFRQLGRKPAGRPVPALGDRTDQGAGRTREGAASARSRSSDFRAARGHRPQVT